MDLTTTWLVNEFLDGLKENTEFGLRDIQSYIYCKTNGHKQTFDGTCGRLMRRWRTDNPDWNIVCFDNHKSRYKKIRRVNPTLSSF